MRLWLYVVVGFFLFYILLAFAHVFRPLPKKAVVPYLTVQDEQKGKHVYIISYNEKDDFEFFKRLGKVHYPHLSNKCQFVATLVRHPLNNQKLWFIADFRTCPSLRGHHLSAWFFNSLLPIMLLQSQKFYGIVTHPDGSSVAYLRTWSSMLENLKINLYVVSQNDLRDVPHRFRHVGAIDTRRQKSLIDTQESNTMPILHLLPEDYKCKEQDIIFTTNRNDAKYMFWLPEYETCAFDPWAQANIVHCNMNPRENFLWLSTADM